LEWILCTENAGRVWESEQDAGAREGAMGYDLRSEGGTFRWNVLGWESVLRLAHRNGWKPAGTERPQFKIFHPDGTFDAEGTEEHNRAYDGWDGSYFYNDCQVVTTEDARNLADALEKALPGLPDEPGPMLSDPTDSDPPPDVVLSGREMKAYIAEFVTYCRAGGFRIG
jgi:hypothetical protein